MFEIFYYNMVWQSLVLPYLPQKWYGNCHACRTGAAAHGYYGTLIGSHGCRIEWDNFR